MESVEKKTKIRAPARASIWYVAASVISRGVGVLGTPVFTRLLSIEEYGLFPLYNTWLTLLSGIVTLELTGVVIYNGLDTFGKRREEFISAALGLCLALNAVFFLLLFTFPSFFEGISGIPFQLLVVMALHIFLNTGIALFNARNRYEYKYAPVVAIGVISSVAIPVIALELIEYTTLRAEARIIASVIVSAFFSSIAIYSIVKGSRRIVNLRIWKYLLLFNLPLLPHYFGVMSVMRIAEASIGRIYGQVALGKYSVASSVGLSLNMLTGGLGSAMSPWIIRKLRQGNEGIIKETVYNATRALCTVCLILLCIAPDIVSIVTPREYYEATPAVYPLALSVIPTFLSGIITSMEASGRGRGLASLPAVLSALLSLALSLSVLPHTDYRVGSVIVLLSQSLMCAAGVLVYRRIHGGVSPIYIKKTLTLAAITLVYATLIFLLRENIVSRILLAIPLLPPLFSLARELWGTVKEQ